LRDRSKVGDALGCGRAEYFRPLLPPYVGRQDVVAVELDTPHGLMLGAAEASARAARASELRRADTGSAAVGPVRILWHAVGASDVPSWAEAGMSQEHVVFA
jgi:hypothetical protein